MTTLINITFSEGSFAIGPFREPSNHPDLVSLSRYDLEHRGVKWVMYHNKFLSAENEATIRKWIDSQYPVAP